jgi:hypothetical protein
LDEGAHREDDRRQTASGPLAPIAFFAFRRPWTTLQALYSLSRCPEAAGSELHVFSDGPRTDADREAVALVREVVRSHRWCSRVEVHESPQNLGLARSVIHGIGSLCRTHGRVIVLEDDLLVSNGFLHYMNGALDLYRDEAVVMQISGHSFPAFAPESRAVLLPAVTSWGWATWQRAWSQFEEVPEGWEELRSDHRLRRSFDLDGAYPYSRLLEATVAGKIDTWDIFWWWTVHRRGGLGLFPLRTLVRNIGFGEDATHTRGSLLLEAPHWRTDASIDEFPALPKIDEEIFRRWKEYLRVQGGSLPRRLFGRAAAALRSRGLR